MRPHRLSVEGVLLGLLASSFAFPQKHRIHIGVRGGAFLFGRMWLRFAVLARDVFLDDFWLRFGLPAMGISVLEEFLFLGGFLDFLLIRLEGHGESVLEVYVPRTEPA